MAKQQTVKLSDKIKAFESSGAHREELSADVQALIRKHGQAGVHRMRFAEPSAHAPTNEEKLARMGDPAKFAELMQGKDPATSGGIYKADDLDRATLAAVYRSVMAPFIWFWRLPALGEVKIKNFATHATMWVKRYLPNGLPLFDHIALIGVALDGLWDCFQRKGKGEEPQFKRAPPKPRDDDE